MRRVARAPAIVVGAWVVVWVVSLPPALAVRRALANHLGSSLAAETAAEGVNYDWIQEFSAQATGAAATVGPSMTGFAAVVDNASAFMDNVSRPWVVVAATSLYVLLWILTAGPIIDGYARRGDSFRA
jgi:hypothetical protein